MEVKVRVLGLSQLEQGLSELPRATGKNVLRRVLRQRGELIAERARNLAPVDEGELKDSIAVSTKLSRSQRRKRRKKATVEMFVGPGTHPQAITQEFGTWFHPPQPFMRPAWAAEKGSILEDLSGDLWTEIDKAAQRIARKQARLAKKNAGG